MFIKHSTGTIDSVFKNKAEAEKEIKKNADSEKIVVEKEKEEDKLNKEKK